MKTMEIPQKMAELLDTLGMVDNEDERSAMLIDFAGRFKEVPREIASRPFSEDRKVKYCESEAYVWDVEKPDGTLQFYFAVENPSGISAKALAYLLNKGLSGQPLEEVASISPDIVRKIFRENISMGKGMGLMSMVDTVRLLAALRIKQSRN
jgi:cysteine desulfuration protein SufE